MVPDPEQVFYKLSELSEMLGVETSVLRFWEKEFPQIKPMKVSQRKRLYRRKDFETFREIKHLLYEERFTIAGAKKRLEQSESRQGVLFDDRSVGSLKTGHEDYEAIYAELKAARQTIEEIRRDLIELKIMISNPWPFPFGGDIPPKDEYLRTAARPKVDGPIIVREGRPDRDDDGNK